METLLPSNFSRQVSWCTLTYDLYGRTQLNVDSATPRVLSYIRKQTERYMENIQVIIFPNFSFHLFLIFLPWNPSEMDRDCDNLGK